ncbi:hypothetical protein Bca4012_027392 [Brassica carinata]
MILCVGRLEQPLSELSYNSQLLWPEASYENWGLEGYGLWVLVGLFQVKNKGRLHSLFFTSLLSRENRSLRYLSLFVALRLSPSLSLSGSLRRCRSPTLSVAVALRLSPSLSLSGSLRRCRSPALSVAIVLRLSPSLSLSG